MKTVVISSAPFVALNNEFYAYSPYAKEITLWAKHTHEIAFLCPVLHEDKGLLLAPISFKVSKIFEVKEFNIKTLSSLFKAFLVSFFNFYQLFRAMLWADHIHLRCPGNIGLMACFVQIFFPSKPKTAKYAGNWDPKSKQPFTYRLQRWILSSTFLTKNMQVLVYGRWEGSSKNIKPFFTATYTEADKVAVAPRNLSGVISVIFVGTLSAGKRPLYAIQIVESLKKLGLPVTLSIYGNGDEKQSLQTYIDQNQLSEFVFLKGNFSQENMKRVFQEAHLLILPSQSEGWPKVLAEAMFWGCVPATTKVSCIGWMLDNGNRGVFLNMTLQEDVQKLYNLLKTPEEYTQKAHESMVWSRKYTLDLFENEIKAMLHR